MSVQCMSSPWSPNILVRQSFILSSSSFIHSCCCCCCSSFSLFSRSWQAFLLYISFPSPDPPAEFVPESKCFSKSSLFHHIRYSWNIFPLIPAPHTHIHKADIHSHDTRRVVMKKERATLMYYDYLIITSWLPLYVDG
jgi:hypothetical protein